MDILKCVEKCAFYTYNEANTTCKINPNDFQCQVSWKRVKCLEEIKWTLTENKTSPQVIYKGSYDNTTDEKAVHKIKLDTATDATYTLSLERGQTKTLPVPLTIKLPDEVSLATNAFGHSIKLDTNEPSSTKTEKIKWAVESEVSNQPGTNLEATVEMIDKSLSGTFEGNALLEGTFAVTFVETNKKTTKFVEFSTCHIAAFDESQTLKADGNSVSWSVKGSINFIFGINHDVKLCNVPPKQDSEQDSPATGQQQPATGQQQPATGQH